MKHKSFLAACAALALSCAASFAAAPTFLPAKQIATSGTSPAGLVTADIDGDGKMDIVYADAGSEKVTVLLNSGSGQFTQSDIFLTSSNEVPDTVAVGNLFTSVSGMAVNSHPDIVLASSSVLHVLQNKGNGVAGVVNFQEQATLSDPNAYLQYFRIGDVNGDGYDDIVAVGETFGQLDSAVVDIFINKGAAGGFYDPVVIPMNVFPTGVILAPLNGTAAYPDIIMSGVDGSGFPQLVVFKNDGSGSFDSGTNYQLNGSPEALAAADLMGDGRSEIGIVEERLFKLANGEFQTRLEFQYALTGTDGTLSSFSSSFPIATMVTPSQPSILKTGLSVFKNPTDLALDVAVANPIEGGVTIGHFMPKLDVHGNFSAFIPDPILPVTVKTAPGARYVALADLNGDKRPDVVTANASANNISVLIDTAGLPAKVKGPDYKVSVAVTAPLGGTVAASGTLHYTITYTNVGVTAGHVLVVGANVPKHTTFLGGDAGVGKVIFMRKAYVGLAAVGPRDPGILNPGQSASFSFQVGVAANTRVGTKLRIGAIVAGQGGPGGSALSPIESVSP